MLEESHLKSFSKGINLYKANKLQKLLKSPLKMIYSKTAEIITEIVNIPFQLEAKTFWGDDMTIIFPELVSLGIFRYGFYEEGLTMILLKFLNSGMVFFDIGSHFGYYSLLASRIVGENGEVHSFEPTPSAFRVLKVNAKKKTNIVVKNCAIWSKNTKISFKDFSLKFCAFNSHFNPRLRDEIVKKLRPKTYQVRAISLDSYVKKTKIVPDFVKVDAENSEAEIIKGMECTLSDHRPIMTIEVGDTLRKGYSPSRKILEYMKAREYDIFEYDNGVIKKHYLKSNYKHDNVLLLPKR